MSMCHFPLYYLREPLSLSPSEFDGPAGNAARRVAPCRAVSL